MRYLKDEKCKIHIAVFQALNTSAYQIMTDRKSKEWNKNLIKYLNKTKYSVAWTAVHWGVSSTYINNLIKDEKNV